MSGVGRFTVRVVAYITLLFLVGLAITLILSGGYSLQALGALLVLFLIDRSRHAKGGDKKIRECLTKNPIPVHWCVSSVAFGILERAFERSAVKRTEVLLEIFQEVLKNPAVEEGLERLEISPKDVGKRIQEAAGEIGMSWEERRKQVEVVVVEALKEAEEARHDFIEPTDILRAFTVLKDPNIERILNIFSIEAADLEGAVLAGELMQKMRKLTSFSPGGVRMRRDRRHRVMNRAWTARPTPTLDAYSTDFTDLARLGSVGFLVGHNAEMERIIEILARPLNPNVLLVGETGAGKETLVGHLALRLTKDEVPKSLFDKRLVGLNVTELVAGAPPEVLHARLQSVVTEIIDAGNIILYLPDIHNFLKTSSSAYLSVADALTPILRDNVFPVIGTTYPREYAAAIEMRSDVTALFETIRVEEISEKEAITVLTYDALLLEQQYGVKVTFGAIKSAVRLAKQYVHEKLLPTSAEELLKSAVAAAQQRKEKLLRHEGVIHALEARVNVPIHEAEGEEVEKLLHLEEIIHARMIDQEEAVHAVADAFREYRSGLARRGGPIATFLFVGPTGVGKTELAKTLAEVEFGSEKAMIRFDMTEYQEIMSIRRFIGTSDGTVDGALTRAVREKPYCVVLLDEFEKAHANILDLFLQVFDDGRLTDALGRTVSFENTVLIATSNAHSDLINEALRKGQSMGEIAEYLKSRLTDVFRPELINRFSKIVIFKDLGPKELQQIAMLQVKELEKILETQGIMLRVEDSAIELLAKIGYEPQFGARPLRRVLEEKIRAPLSKEILEKKMARGNTVTLRAEGNIFQFISDGKI